MKTFWNATICSAESHGCCIVGAEDLNHCLEQAIQEAAYMQAVHPDYRVSIRDITESCAVCRDAGTVRNAHNRAVRCPECKGKRPAGKLSDIRFLMPISANSEFRILEINCPLVYDQADKLGKYIDGKLQSIESNLSPTVAI